MIFLIPFAMILAAVLAGCFLAVPMLIILTVILIISYVLFRNSVNKSPHSNGIAGLGPIIYGVLALFCILVMWIIHFSTSTKDDTQHVLKDIQVIYTDVKPFILREK